MPGTSWAWAPGDRSGAGYVILSVSCHPAFLYQAAMAQSRLRKQRTGGRRAGLGCRSRTAAEGRSQGWKKRAFQIKMIWRGPSSSHLPPQGTFRVSTCFSSRLPQTPGPLTPRAAGRLARTTPKGPIQSHAFGISPLSLKSAFKGHCCPETTHPVCAHVSPWRTDNLSH